MGSQSGLPVSTMVAPGTRSLELQTPSGIVSVREGTVTWTRPDFEVTVDLSISERRGRVEASRVVVTQAADGPEVSVRALQRLHLGRYINKAFELLSGAADPGWDGGAPLQGVRSLLSGMPSPAPAPLLRAARRGIRFGAASAYSPDELRGAAAAYRRALARQTSTGQAVVEALGVSADSARQVVRRCRTRVDPATGKPYLPAANTTRPTLADL